jgi:CHAT domain-containing protein
VYKGLGKYEKAEPYYLEVLDIQRRVSDEINPEQAGAIINMGNLYKEIGNYEKAIQYYLEAKAIFETQLEDKEHPFYYNCLIGLASAYWGVGDLEKAETIISRHKAYMEENQDKENPNNIIEILPTLANIYLELGRTEKFEAVLKEYDNIPEAEDPDNLMILLEMAYINFRINKLEKSEKLCLKAKSIFEKSGQMKMSSYEGIMNTLGLTYLQMKQYEKAETVLLELHVRLEESYGLQHPKYATSLENLALLYEKQNRYSASEPFLEKLFTIEQAWLSKATCYLSEFEIARYAASLQANRDRVCSYYFARAAAKHPSSLPALAYDQALFLKGFLLNSAARLNILSGRYPETEETYRNLKDYRRRLAAEYAKPIEERRNMAALEESATTTEKKLASLITGTSYADAGRQVKWREVQATLKAGEAAIEFIHFRVNFPEETDSVLYAALLLLPGADQPRFIPLFEAKQLDILMNPSKKKRADWVNELYQEEAENGQKTLYELLWKPIEPALAGVKTIYFSSSGQLHRLNISAIATPPELRGQSGTKTLGERFRLFELGSTRQLVVDNARLVEDNRNDALLFGGIQYEMDSTTLVSTNTGLENNLAAFRNRGLNFAGADSTLRGGRWQYLPWTKVEVTALDGILTKAGIQTTLRINYAATEESFKSIGLNQPSPRILHLATHGFFFPDPRANPPSEIRNPTSEEPVFKMSDHPMIRSGLLLAGGNYAWEKGKPFKPEAEDGILTAYEISQMDLSHTELVVLSACETGLGDIQGNEGVYGLQRAFKIAGAKYLIMSLWQVPDFQTQQLMSTFYRYWLQDKRSIPDAFSAAQQEMKEKFEHPFFWAGFVLVE